MTLTASMVELGRLTAMVQLRVAWRQAAPFARKS